ncbi:MAG: hypothetical protein CMH24_02470 [Nitrosomonadales bacterium]|nr:hypothetical protein [Nitrosomonadales bacterium]|tara:strand:- start:451 stop:966 length:516 start_codon:yes stop_codon:yes gene_type:complete
MLKKIIWVLFLSTIFSSATGQTFKEFTSGNYFAPIDEKYLQLTAKCRKVYDEKDRKKYFEILFFNQEKNIFDMNKHYKTYLQGRKKLKPPVFSFTVRNWFQTIAIESGKYNFITTTDQNTLRRNEVIPKDLSKAILNSGQFNIYFHFLNDNTKSIGRFKVSNNKVLIDCFE